MASQKYKHQINLLPQNEFDSTTFGRILTWTLSTFRIIVIVTEMVVMLAFLSRFWLDAQNSDLNNLLRQKQTVIAASKNFEDEFKLTQKKLAIFSSLTNSSLPMSTAIETITKSEPPEVILKNVSVVENDVRLTGSSLSEAAIAQFMVNLDAQKAFDTVALTQVDASADLENLITFALSMKYNP